MKNVKPVVLLILAFASFFVASSSAQDLPATEPAQIAFEPELFTTTGVWFAL
jgi:hypothetical protein